MRTLLAAAAVLVLALSLYARPRQTVKLHQLGNRTAVVQNLTGHTLSGLTVTRDYRHRMPMLTLGGWILTWRTITVFHTVKPVPTIPPHAYQGVTFSEAGGNRDRSPSEWYFEFSVR